MNQEHEYCFVPALPLTQEDLLDAVHRIENQSSRQLEELFWIHELGGQFELRNKTGDEIRARLRADAENNTTKGAVALHNAAVVLTLIACNCNGNKRMDYWRDAIQFWKAVADSGTFWQFLEDRAVLLDEDRNLEPISETRNELGRILATTLVEELWSALRAHDSHASSALIEICTEHESWLHAHEKVREAAEQQAKEATVGIGAELDLIAVLTEETDKHVVRQSLWHSEQQIDRIAKEANRVLASFGGVASENGIADTQAFALRQLSACYFKLLGDYNEALRLVARARHIAQSPSLQESLDGDWRTVQIAILIEEAIPLEEAGRNDAADEKLSAALNLCTGEQQQQITEIRARFCRARVLRNVDTRRRSPSLQTINGCGFRFYGRRDFDADSRSYVTTHWFVFLFLPIFPVTAYRVADAGPGRYNIYGKVPLSPFLSKYRWAIVIAVLGFIVFSNIDSGSNLSTSLTSSGAQVQPSSPSPNTPSYSSPPATSAQSTGSSTHEYSEVTSKSQERVEIEEERDALKRLEDQLDASKQTLDEEKASLDRIEAYLSSVKETYTSDTVPGDIRQRYNNSVSEYNARVPAYNRSLREYNAAVDVYEQKRASFNARVDRYNASR